MQAFKSPVSWIKLALVLAYCTAFWSTRLGKNLRTKLLATAYVNVTLWLLKQQLFKLVGGPQKKCCRFSISGDQLPNGCHFRCVQLMAQKRFRVLHAQIRRSWKSKLRL